MPSEPVLVAPPARDPRAVVLLLHGGRSRSEAPVTRWQLAVLRMLPIGWAIRARVGDVAVARLRYRYRGWNDPYAHPVADARNALDRMTERYGDVPVILVGHSMGARTAVHVADDPRVHAVVGLAPWLTETDRVDSVGGIRVAILHGERDRVTDPRASLQWTRRAARTALGVVWVGVRGDGHAMVRRWRTFHRLTAEFVEAVVSSEPPRPPLTNAWVRRPETVEQHT